MNRIQSLETESLFPVVVVRGALLVNGLRVMAVVDHDAEEIRVSSLAPQSDVARLIRAANEMIPRHMARKGAFAEVWETCDQPGEFIVQPAPYRSPSRPQVRAGVRRRFNAYDVPGVASVEAWPHRPLKSARQLARRVYRDPSYLDVVRALALPGVTILAPRSRRGRRVA
jgi:hypothetical protein